MTARRSRVLVVSHSCALPVNQSVYLALLELGWDVHIVMTKDALHFVTALPFKTLSRHPVVTDLYEEEEGWKGFKSIREGGTLIEYADEDPQIRADFDRLLGSRGIESKMPSLVRA